MFRFKLIVYLFFVQVLRNHELVGQVSLDQVEAKIGRMLKENDGYNSDNEEVEPEEIATDFDEVLQTTNVAEYDNQEKTVLSSEEAQENQEQDQSEESPAKSSSSDIQDNTDPNTTVQKRHEQHLKTEEMTVALIFSAGQAVIKTEPNLEEYINEGVRWEDCSEPEKEQTNKCPSRPTDEQEQISAESSSCFHMADIAHTSKLHIKDIQSINVKIEDDMVQDILLLDENGSKSHKWKDQKHTIKIEPNTEARNVDCNVNDDALLEKEDSTTLAQNPNIQANTTAAKMNQANNTRVQEGVSCNSISMTFPSNYSQLPISYKDSVGLWLGKQEKEQAPETCMEASEPCGEMPVLEKECHIGKRQHLVTCEEEDETEKLGLKQQEEEVEMTEDETKYKKQEISNIHNGKYVCIKLLLYNVSLSYRLYPF